MDKPLDIAYCLPTPSEPERAAVQSLGLPATIDFTLQWTIYRMQQQGTPNQVTRVSIQFDPQILSLTATIALARQHGMVVEHQREESHYLSGIMALDAVPQLAAELAAYLERVWTAEQALQPVERATTTGEVEVIAFGFERQEELTATVTGEQLDWTERRLILRSVGQAQAAEQALRARVTKAQTKLEALNERKQGKKRLRDGDALRQRAEAIVARYQVGGLLQLTYGETVREHPVQAYGGQPAGIRQERDVWVQVTVYEAALQAACQRLGWKAYATNAERAGLSLTEATLAYRSEYLVERCFGRLKGKPLTAHAHVPAKGRARDRLDPLALHLLAGPDGVGVCRPPASGGGEN